VGEEVNTLKIKIKTLEITGNDDVGDNIVMEVIDEGGGSYISICNYNGDGSIAVGFDDIECLIEALGRLKEEWGGEE
jgi:hypothetical protein